MEPLRYSHLATPPFHHSATLHSATLTHSHLLALTRTHSHPLAGTHCVMHCAHTMVTYMCNSCIPVVALRLAGLGDRVVAGPAARHLGSGWGHSLHHGGCILRGWITPHTHSLRALYLEQPARNGNRGGSCTCLARTTGTHTRPARTRQSFAFDSTSRAHISPSVRRGVDEYE
jgi:hypothetical protein